MNDGSKKIGQVWEFRRPKSNLPGAMWYILSCYDDGHRVWAVNLYTGLVSHFDSASFFEFESDHAFVTRVA